MTSPLTQIANPLTKLEIPEGEIYWRKLEIDRLRRRLADPRRAKIDGEGIWRWHFSDRPIPPATFRDACVMVPAIQLSASRDANARELAAMPWN
ncbi:hypothetical protein HN937_16975 [Candidatus Poribacteria bacterium]|jgi:hypothetical protein|nr:hypothetical protein [Candidatus Poribacteria bacterium]